MRHQFMHHIKIPLSIHGRWWMGLLILLPFIWMGCESNKKYMKGQSYQGFKLIETRFVQEVNAECLYFIHEKSGARLFKIMADDANKTFAIAYKTVPEDDCGTPHIIEHSVLNGSKNFPVKSPFDRLLQGSLNTFLNAMTGGDMTVYPVASMNDKDYFNLMHVYLDAVFNPLIYTDERIFMQEGWHYEMQDVRSPQDSSLTSEVEYKGVVYNEMKGVYSNALSELEYQRARILFPDNGYGLESGGHPSAIPQLTYEKFLNFHRKYYHPSNSYILLYGNANLEQELQLINDEYLANYTRSETEITIPLQTPFAQMKRETKPYALADDEDTDQKTYLSLSFVTGKNTDLALVKALDVLTEALVNQESAPLRRALLDAGIGQDVSASMSEMQQNVFEIRVQNANTADTDRFYQIVMAELQKVVENGLDSAMVEGIINRMEFQLREGDTPHKGLMYFFMNMSNWMFAQDPYIGLEYEKYLKNLKDGIQNGYLKTVVKDYLINNPHVLLLTLEPQKGLQSILNKQVKDELADYGASLTNEQKEALVQKTTELIEYQQREDDSTALATIPMLELTDIGKTGEWSGVVEKDQSSTKVLHCNEFTNGIIYSSLFFDASVIDKQDIPYIRLLSEVLGKLPTQAYDFGTLDNTLNRETGGFNTSFTGFLKNRSDDTLQPKFEVSAKTLHDKSDALFGLINEIINHSKYDDHDRLKELLTRHQSQIDQRMKQNGMNVALTRLYSYHSNQGMFAEMRGGLEYYRFLNDLVANYETKKGALTSKLTEISARLFTQKNMIVGVTCNDDEYSQFVPLLNQFIAKLNASDAQPQQWVFDPKPKNEGIITASKVQFVLQGANFKKLGYEWNGRIRVLDQLLSTDYLQTQVRVIGGAYGGFSRFEPSGNVYFASYRDPNLKETLDNYQGTTAYLDSLTMDSKAMTRFIIGTISKIDRPKTASEKGDEAFYNYFTGVTKETVQKERTEILSTSPEDLKQMNKMVSDILNQKIWCVYGNDEKLKAADGLFQSLVSLQ